MAKKFVPVHCQKKVYRLYQEDIKKIFYMGRISLPKIPEFKNTEEKFTKRRDFH
jgi:hypothetical protein